MVATATPTNDQLVKALQVGQLKGEKGKELQQQNAFGEILKIVSTNLNQPGESGPYQDQTTYPKETEGQKLKPGDYIDSGDPITDDNMGPDGRPLESRMFDIDPKKHKTQQKQGKIRNLADQGTTEGEKEAAKGKLKDQTDLPNFLQNINIKPQDLLKILQLIPAATGFNLQMANAAGDKMIQGLPRGGYYGNSHRPARESGELTDDKLLETLKIAGPLLMQAQAPANNIRRLQPDHQTVLDDNRPGHLKIIKTFKPPKA